MNGRIYVLGNIAHDATKYICDKKKGGLSVKFPPFFMRLVGQFCMDGDEESRRIRESLPEIREAAAYCEEMGEGGILNALWYMAESLGTGFEIRLRSIPIAQQTVEVLEAYDVNPYYARSRGAWLVLAGDEARLVQIFADREIPYAQIGFANDLRVRTILNGDSVRYLDRPQVDALNKIE
ncbi:MAG: AIR synthase-related protein [Lachnospiraceae bacterium]|nr:AIR synthase-related protein [Lachnospiraceae bacterium]